LYKTTHTPECRRAVVGTLPLLRLARQVSVIAIASEEELALAADHVKDVAQWLLRHGVKAEADAVARNGDDVRNFAELV
jgi:hypothetical protein